MLRIFVLLVVVALSPLIAQADQITSGSIGWSPGPTFFTNFHVQFSGASFAVSNGLAQDSNVGVFRPCSSPPYCAAGSSVSLGGSVSLDPTDWSFGTVIVNGVTYPVFTMSGQGLSIFMSFSAGSMIIPVSSDPTITLTAPFTLIGGSMRGPDPNSPSRMYFVPFTYTGGTASLTLSRVPNDPSGAYSFAGIRYSFEPIPAPEPATMLLLGTGLAGIVAKVRKRRRSTS